MAAENLGDILPNKMPTINVSAINKLRTGFNFVVMLNEFTYGFKDVSGLQVHRETMREQEGGVNDHMYLVGKPDDDQPTLTLERGYIIRSLEVVSDGLYSAACAIPSQLGRKAAMLAASATSPVLSLEKGPSTGLIMVFDRRQKLYAIFAFLSLGMIEWNMTDLSATNNDVMIERITLAHTGIERIPLSWVPGFADAVRTWANGSDDGMDAMREIVEKNNRQFKERQKKIQALEKAKKALQEEHMKLYAEQVKLAKERDDLNFNEDGSYKTQEELKEDALARIEARRKASDENLEAIQKEEARARADAEAKREAAKSDLQKALDEQNKKAKAEISDNTKEAAKNADTAEDVKKRAEANEQIADQREKDYEKRKETADKLSAAAKKQDDAAKEKVVKKAQEAVDNAADDVEKYNERMADNETIRQQREADSKKRDVDAKLVDEVKNKQDAESLKELHKKTAEARNNNMKTETVTKQVAKKDENGNEVLDANGNPVYEDVKEVVTTYKDQKTLAEEAQAKLKAQKEASDADLEEQKAKETAARAEAEAKREAEKSDLQKALDEQNKNAKAEISDNTKEAAKNADTAEDVKKRAEANEQIAKDRKADSDARSETAKAIDKEKNAQDEKKV